MPLTAAMFTTDAQSDEFFDDVRGRVVKAEARAYREYGTKFFDDKRCWVVFTIQPSPDSGYQGEQEVHYSLGDIKNYKPAFVRDGELVPVDTSVINRENKERLCGPCIWSEKETISGKSGFAYLVKSLEKAGFKNKLGPSDHPNLMVNYAGRLDAHFKVKVYEVKIDGDDKEQKVTEVTEIFEVPEEGFSTDGAVTEKVVKGLQEKLPVKLENLVSTAMELDLTPEEAEEAQSLVISESWVSKHLTIEGDNITAAA